MAEVMDCAMRRWHADWVTVWSTWTYEQLRYLLAGASSANARERRAMEAAREAAQEEGEVLDLDAPSTPGRQVHHHQARPGSGSPSRDA